MGRIADLCGEIAAEAEEGADGLVLPPETWDRLREEWTDEEIEDALNLVRENLLQSELVESADNLSARVVEVLGALGEAAAFERAQTSGARLGVDVIGQLARRVARLEEVLDVFRDRPGPDRRGFDALQRRLADYGIGEEMDDPEPLPPEADDDEDEE